MYQKSIIRCSIRYWLNVTWTVESLYFEGQMCVEHNREFVALKTHPALFLNTDSNTEGIHTVFHNYFTLHSLYFIVKQVQKTCWIPSEPSCCLARGLRSWGTNNTRKPMQAELNSLVVTSMLCVMQSHLAPWRPFPRLQLQAGEVGNIPLKFIFTV